MVIIVLDLPFLGMCIAILLLHSRLNQRATAGCPALLCFCITMDVISFLVSVFPVFALFKIHSHAQCFRFTF